MCSIGAFSSLPKNFTFLGICRWDLLKSIFTHRRNGVVTWKFRKMNRRRWGLGHGTTIGSGKKLLEIFISITERIKNGAMIGMRFCTNSHKTEMKFYFNMISETFHQKRAKIIVGKLKRDYCLLSNPIRIEFKQIKEFCHTPLHGVTSRHLITLWIK